MAALGAAAPTQAALVGLYLCVRVDVQTVVFGLTCVALDVAIGASVRQAVLGPTVALRNVLWVLMVALPPWRTPSWSGLRPQISSVA